MKHANDESLAIKDRRNRNWWHLVCAEEVRFLPKDRLEFLLHVTDVDDLGRTPLHYLLIDEEMSLHNGIDALTKYCSDSENASEVATLPLSAQDEFGRTPFHYAAITEFDVDDRQQLRDLLMSTFASHYDFSIRDKFGMTFDDYAQYQVTSERTFIEICRSQFAELDNFKSRIEAFKIFRRRVTAGWTDRNAHAINNSNHFLGNRSLKIDKPMDTPGQ